MPIKALNTFMRDWVIKARVASKNMRETRNNGHLLKLELIDEYGTPIEGTFFNDAAIKFNNLVCEGRVYTFSHGNVKIANKRFSSVNNEFNIIFEVGSKVQEVKDDKSIPNQTFDFKKISQIEDNLSLKFVDVIGVIISAS